MQTGQMIQALSEWGRMLKKDIDDPAFEAKKQEAFYHNRWFTPDNINRALFSIADKYLRKEKLERWLASCSVPAVQPKTTGIVMAGNIPLVGFHDLLSVLVSGHNALVKLSSKDKILLPFILKYLYSLEPGFREKVKLADKLSGFDAIIATGSNNTSRYFHYYFGRYPHIIRKNRNSVSILTGEENEEDLKKLGKDVFRYFGLGCRNVSKLMIPEHYDFQKLFDAFDAFRDLKDHEKYINNYAYHKSIFIMENIQFRDSGFLLLREYASPASPMATLHYEKYRGQGDLNKKLNRDEGQIQCKVGDTKAVRNGSIPFGQAQEPELWDYADNVDVLKFLEQL